MKEGTLTKIIGILCCVAVMGIMFVLAGVIIDNNIHQFEERAYNCSNCLKCHNITHFENISGFGTNNLTEEQYNECPDCKVLELRQTA